MARLGVPGDVAAIRQEIGRFMDTRDDSGRPIGSALGVYAFFDYDDEPIYVGQTYEGLRSRVGRHLTNQRTDAVAMNVLDPFEVAWIEIWPLVQKADAVLNPSFYELLNRAEFSVFQMVLAKSSFKAVLNEAELRQTMLVELPKSYKGRIIPDDLFEVRKHPDIRIARRAATIARLAQVISERDVSAGLRQTLVTQAKRLQKLAAERFEEFKAEVPVEQPGTETGD